MGEQHTEENITDLARPRVSVIVPFRNRRELLAQLLEALDAQTFADFEVIVVDDGSTDGADQVAANAIVAGRTPRLLRSGGAGAVAARLYGVAESRAEILAFTDSDCAPTPGWLEAGVRTMDGGVDMVNGLTRPVRQVGPLERSVSSAGEGLYPTCNMFFRRSAYDAVGGFDAGVAERLGFRPGRLARGLGFCEDTLIAWRIRRSRPWAFAPDAVVEHHVFPADAREWLRRSAMLGAFPAVISEVPELRETLMHGPVLFPQFTRLPVYVLAIAVSLRSRRLAGLSLVTWLGLQLGEYRATGAPLRDCLRALPAKLVIDAVSCGSLLAGSVRTGTLTL